MLVFLDADVVLAPQAVAATVQLLRAAGLDLASPYPRQLAETWSERLVQPLLQWSWLTLLPLRRAESSPRPSLAAANGQLLAVDAEAYRRVGGHAAVRAEVLDDVALRPRAQGRAAARGGVVDGTWLATCRMYEGWPTLRAGYTKSAWAAFGSPAGAAAVRGRPRRALRRAAARRAARLAWSGSSATAPRWPAATSWPSAPAAAPCRTAWPTRRRSLLLAGSPRPPWRRHRRGDPALEGPRAAGRAR